MLAALLPYAASRPPDVIVSPDARLIAVSASSGPVLLRASHASAYMAAQMQAAWGGRIFAALDTSQCGGGICRLSVRNGTLSIALAPPEDCPDDKLIVSSVPLRGVCDAPGRVVVDRFTVWHDGAVAVWQLPSGIRVLSDRQIQGSRPWVPPWPEWQWEVATK